MAKGVPGVVRVQENRTTKTNLIVIPKIVLEDIGLQASDFVRFAKTPDGVWQFHKITPADRDAILAQGREARRESLAAIG